MKQGTEKQIDLLRFIEEHQKQYKVMPTYVEMSSKFGVTNTAIAMRIEALTRKGYLERKNIYIIKK